MKCPDLISLHFFLLETTKPSYRASGCHNGGLTRSHTTRRIFSKHDLRSNISKQSQVLLAVKALLSSVLLMTLPILVLCLLSVAPSRWPGHCYPEYLRAWAVNCSFSPDTFPRQSGHLSSLWRQHFRNIFYLKDTQPAANSCQITYSNSYLLISLFIVCF